MEALKIEFPSIYNPAISEDKKTILKKKIVAASREGRLRCPSAMAIANSLGINSKEVGEVADELDIKIASCQLGCF